MTLKKRLFLVDGMAQIYRAHFAMIKNPLITKDGRYTSAVFGFFNSLFKLIREENPDYIAVVLDSKEPTFRHKLYTDYKATREKMPDELVEQLSPILKILDFANISTLKKPGFEADDIIGTLAKKAEKSGLVTYMVTGDKDMMQLVSDDIFMYSPGNSFKPKTIYDKNKVKDKWGVGPNKIVDMLALVGDSSDNIPGVDGVGVKTAKKLLDEYNSIENIIQNAENAKNKRVREGLNNGRDLVYLSRNLATIECDVPLEFHLDELIYKDMDIAKMEDIFKELEMNSLIKQLDTIKSTSSFNYVKPDKKYLIILDIIKLEELIKKINSSNFISFDLETTSLKIVEAEIVGISFSIKANEAFYIPILYPEKNDIPGLDLNIVLDILKPVFEDKNNRFCGQNIKYDALVLKKYEIDINNIYYDTMVAEYLLYPEKNSYKLDYLSIDYLRYKMMPIEKLIGSGFEQCLMSEVPLDDIAYYACEDADIVLQIKEIQEQKLKSESLFKPFIEIENSLIPVLVEIESNGVFLDIDFLKKLSIKVGEKIDKLSEVIYQITDKKFNINSPKQLAEVLFDDFQLKQIRKRSTAVEVLEILKDHHPLPLKILEYRHLSKLKNTYIDAIPNHINNKTGRIHTSLNQTITSTGRLSSASPNFQNIPIRTDLGKEIRKAFVPQNDKSVILSADYSQVELRIMAHFSKEPALINAFKEGVDFHSRTAALVNFIDESDVTLEQRRSAKVINFGIMYGAGPYRMSQELGISMLDAKNMIEEYFITYPGIKDYMDKTLSVARERGYVETLFGRRRFIGNLNVSNRNIVQADERAAINMPIQGTAADIIKIAMINIYKKMKKRKYVSKMILQVHDELLFECPISEVDEIAIMVENEMESAVELSVPLKVDWKYGRNWFEAH